MLTNHWITIRSRNIENIGALWSSLWDVDCGWHVVKEWTVGIADDVHTDCGKLGAWTLRGAQVISTDCKLKVETSFEEITLQWLIMLDQIIFNYFFLYFQKQ